MDAVVEEAEGELLTRKTPLFSPLCKIPHSKIILFSGSPNASSPSCASERASEQGRGLAGGRRGGGGRSGLLRN